MTNNGIYEASIVQENGTSYALTLPDSQGKKYLQIDGNAGGFEGHADGSKMLCPLSPANAAHLRHRLSWLNPQPLGLATSAGFGDRLGIATPGHAAAVIGTGIAPIFAQQSVRENARTKRSPQQVVDDAMWGLFEVGWHGKWGADGDHAKTPTDLDAFIAAGYTFFTIDPGEFVDDVAETDDLDTLRQKVDGLDWEILESNPSALREQLLKTVEGEHLNLSFDEHTLLKSAAKYGHAVTHTVKMAHHLQANLSDFDLEMSVDETATTTSLHEHFYIVSELQRLQIPIVSLAPRFVGQFEKGVDYIGDLDELEANIKGHAAIQKYFGNSYKISLHSGSDKFAVYPIAMRWTGGRVHLKTAGTSYLEALRIFAIHDPTFFRDLLEFARQRYTADRQTYHVSADLSRLPNSDNLADNDLPNVLDQFDARQILHVTFGSVLDHFGDDFHQKLRQFEQAYHAGIKAHFDKHLAQFTVS
jgi:hypothetical protein